LNRTDIFTLHQYRIKVDTLSEPIYLIPFGDIHRHTKLCDVEKWIEFLEWAKGKPRIYFIGMGDYDDLMSASERNTLKSAQFHDTTIDTLDGIYERYINELYEEISFMSGKLIGLLEGNHYSMSDDGITSTQRLCQKLKCKYLGVSSFIDLTFDYRDTTQSCSLDIWCHHGKGSARLIGGSLNSVQQMGEQAQADIYLMGHDHRKSIGMTSKLCLNSGANGITLKNRKQLYIRTGSFLRGYVDNHASYIAKMGLNPADLGVVKIELTPRKRADNNGNLEIDLHASI
jgi:predicted phosphodiesterase